MQSPSTSPNPNPNKSFNEFRDSELVIRSPGRINLIGEHTDYNMGYVMPMAIDKHIEFRFRKNNTVNNVNVYSEDFDAKLSIDLNKLDKSTIEWENYILGVLYGISRRTDKLKGFDCTLKSNLLSGAGLSSSAALECGLAFGLNELFNLGLSKLEIVQLSQTAEHTYVGTQCGIMDQFASVMSLAGNVILLDCRSLEYKQIPMQITPYKIVMLNTKVSHNLASSEYNTRKMECEEGVAIIKKVNPEIASLRDVSMSMLKKYKALMSPVVYKRCSFIIDENARVLEVERALKGNDLEKVGQLLFRAHAGISELYEVSCPESDFLVEFAKRTPGVLGARQTGGGFGGCTLNIVHQDMAETFIKTAAGAYRSKFKIDLEAFEVAPGGGTSVAYRS